MMAPPSDSQNRANTINDPVPSLHCASSAETTSKMATDCSSSVLEEHEVAGPTDQAVGQPEQEYDFVEQPDQDLYCPVTFELLLEPHQTECCGQHISERAVDRIIRDGKPCPMCKDDHFTTHKDKYFKRNTINKLKVRCPREKSGCEWVGELGDLNLHSKSCPKRPWKCQHCDFESTYETGTNEHIPNCTKYPLPCPNQCEIGMVPRCDAEKHLLVCPLQLVECEFAHAGCDVKVPRRDLVKHMTENAQQHLMSATLFNLRLTRELHQKMEEKDQQITELQQQVRGLDEKVEGRIQDLEQKVEQQNKHFEELNEKVEHTKTDICESLSMKLQDLRKKMIREIATTLGTHNLLQQGFTCHELTLDNFKNCQTQGTYGDWYSRKFERLFQLRICVNGYSSARRTHLTAFFNQNFVRGLKLKWPIRCTVHLHMLNQLGDYDHYICTTTGHFESSGYRWFNISSTDNTYKFYPLDRLGYCADTDTQYLKDDCLKFRLFLKVENV